LKEEDVMKRIKKNKWIPKHITRLLLAVIIVALLASMSFAHGPKGHTEGFTPWQAVKKGSMMYDKLIASGKLDASWETGLEKIDVYWRETGKKELVVKFSRGAGDPSSVYIFFNEKGGYSGSNFSGK
jgi:hypothetical protein